MVTNWGPFRFKISTQKAISDFVFLGDVFRDDDADDGADDDNGADDGEAATVSVSSDDDGGGDILGRTVAI